MVRIVRRNVAKVTAVFDSAFALIVMLVAFTTVNIGRMPGGVDEFLARRLSVRNVALVILFVAIWRLAFTACGLYRVNPRPSAWSMALRSVVACTMGSICLLFFTTASRSGAFGVEVVTYFWVAAVVIEAAGRAAIFAAAGYLERRARDIKHAVIVGSGARALQLYETLQARDQPDIVSDCVVEGFVDSRNADEICAEIRPRLLARLSELESLLSHRPIDLVLIALPVKSSYQAIQDVIDICERVGVEARYFPDLFSVSLARRAFDQEDDLLGVRLQLVADDNRLVVKRAIDLVGAFCGLTLLAPVFIGCAIAIRFTSPGPVLFSQLRYGYNRRQFRLYKFRTMVQDAERLQDSVESLNEAQGPIFKIRADPRVTPVGRVLRKLSLDELPQLVNVLSGEMSLVGPAAIPTRKSACTISASTPISSRPCQRGRQGAGLCSVSVGIRKRKGSIPCSEPGPRSHNDIHPSSCFRLVPEPSPHRS